MMVDMKQQIDDEKAMSAFGQKLGAALRGGEVLELVGDVGAGKTTLTRAIARGMGIAGSIQSPTFTIVNHHENSAGLALAHYDFYRLHDAGIMRAELQEATSEPHTVTIVEWSDIVQDALPTDRLTIAISLVSSSEVARQLECTAHGERARGLLEALA